MTSYKKNTMEGWQMNKKENKTRLNKKKNKTRWLLMQLPDGQSPVVLYDGPDRKVARSKAEKALVDGVPSVVVFKVSWRQSLTPNALVASLPRESF